MTAFVELILVYVFYLTYVRPSGRLLDLIFYCGLNM